MRSKSPPQAGPGALPHLSTDHAARIQTGSTQLWPYSTYVSSLPPTGFHLHLPLSELSWARFSTPSHSLERGQTLLLGDCRPSMTEQERTKKRLRKTMIQLFPQLMFCAVCHHHHHEAGLNQLPLKRLGTYLTITSFSDNSSRVLLPNIPYGQGILDTVVYCEIIKAINIKNATSFVD